MAGRLDANKANKDGITPLYVASLKGHCQVVDALLTAGAEVDKPTNKGITPLAAATKEGHTKVVEALIAAGANKNRLNQHGAFPLYVAAFFGHTDIVKCLINSGAKKNKVAENGDTALLAAVMKSHTSIVKFLVDSGADLNHRRKNGSTALLASIQKGNVEIVKILLAKGVETNIATKEGLTPLLLACSLNQIQIVKLLLQFDKNIDSNVSDNYGRTPLLIACDQGNTDMVTLLLLSGANVNVCQKNGDTPFLAAACHSDANMISLLLKHKANMYCTRRYDARKKSQEELQIQMILDLDVYNNKNNSSKKKDSNNESEYCESYHETIKSRDDANGDYMTALYLACSHGNADTVKVIFEALSDEDRRDPSSIYYHYDVQNDKDGKTNDGNRSNDYKMDVELVRNKQDTTTTCLDYLYVAMVNKKIDIVRYLLPKLKKLLGNDLDVNNYEFSANKNSSTIMSLLGMAILMKRDCEFVSSLLEAGANPNQYCAVDKQEFGAGSHLKTPLYLASEVGADLSVIEVLIEASADVNAHSMWYLDCPLSIAICNKHSEIALLLISAGAIAWTCDIRGHSPLFHSCNTGNLELVSHLLSHKNQFVLKNEVLSCLDRKTSTGNYNTIEEALKSHRVNCSENILDMIYPNPDDLDKDYVQVICQHENYSHFMFDLMINRELLFGLTPLSVACKQGHEQVVSLLLTHGATLAPARTDQYIQGGIRVLNLPLRFACEGNTPHPYLEPPLIPKPSKNAGKHHEKMFFNNLLKATANTLKKEAGILTTGDSDSDIFSDSDEDDDERDGRLKEVSPSEPTPISSAFVIIVEMLLDVLFESSEYEAIREQILGPVDGCSPLFAACARGFAELVEMLLDRGALEYEATSEKQCSIEYITVQSSISPILFFEDEKYDEIMKSREITRFNVRDFSATMDHITQYFKKYNKYIRSIRNHVLLTTLCRRNITILELLLKNGIVTDIDSIDFTLAKALTYNSLKNDDMGEVLCKYGRDQFQLEYNKERSFSKSPCDPLGSLKLKIMEKYTNRNSKDVLLLRGQMSIRYETVQGEQKAFLTYRVVPNGEDANHEKYEKYGVQKSHEITDPLNIEVVTTYGDKNLKLLNQDDCLQGPREDGLDPLVLACIIGDWLKVELLLRLGADPNVSFNGFRPLHATIGNLWCNLQCLPECLYFDETLDIPNIMSCAWLKRDTRPFMRYIYCMEALLEKGANVNVKDNHGQTPLHRAAYYSFPEAVELLLSIKECDPNILDDRKESPLHKAVNFRWKWKLGQEAIKKLDNDLIGEENEIVDPHTLFDHLKTKMNDIVSDVNDIDQLNNDTRLENADDISRILDILTPDGAENAATRRTFDRSRVRVRCAQTVKAFCVTRKIEVSVNIPDRHGLMPLHRVVASDDAELVLLLLMTGGNLNINAKTEDKITPMHVLAEKNKDGSLEDGRRCAVQNLLLELTSDLMWGKRDSIHTWAPDPNVQAHSGLTPYHVAVLQKDKWLTSFLMLFGANVDQQTSNGLTPLHLCFDPVPIDGDTTTTDDASNTSSDISAVVPKRGDMVEFLVNARADVNIMDAERMTPLHHACVHSAIFELELLIKAGADLNKVDSIGRTPLYISASVNDFVGTEILLKLGGITAHKIDVNKSHRINDNRTPFFIACQKGHIDVVRVLHRFNANVYTPNNKGRSPMGAACHAGMYDVVEYLVKAKVDVNKTADNKNATPLSIAANKGHTRIVALLLKHGAQVYYNDSANPMYFACFQGHLDVVKLLLAHDPELINAVGLRYGVSPLFYATKNSHLEVMKYLLYLGAKPDLFSGHGTTPLIIAAQCYNYHACASLLVNKANPNVQMLSDGNTALHEAIDRLEAANYTQELMLTITILVLNGSDLTIKNAKNKTPLQSIMGHKNDLIRFLKFCSQNAGKSVDPKTKKSVFGDDAPVGTVAFILAEARVTVAEHAMKAYNIGPFCDMPDLSPADIVKRVSAQAFKQMMSDSDSNTNGNGNRNGDSSNDDNT